MNTYIFNNMKQILFHSLLLLLFAIPTNAQQVYPSAGAFWVGGAADIIPTDSATLAQGLRTYQDVVRWEATHADYSAWGGLQYRPYAPNIPVLDYMYAGAITMNGLNVWELGIHPLVIANGHNWEDFFLHYKQDTWLNYTTLYQDSTIWAGVPLAIGYTSGLNDSRGVVLHGTGPWAPADIFQGVSQGGAFYLANSEKFAEATLTFSTGGTHGTILVQYASAVDNQNNITRWTTLILTSDSTSNFSHSGTIRWIPPSNWVWGLDTVPKGVLIPFGHWLKITGTGYNQRPLLTNLHTRPWVYVDPAGAHRGFVKNPGWDSINDRNRDGYVGDNEYPLLDPNATARFRYEARLNIINSSYLPSWSFSISNTVNPNFRHDLDEYYQNYWLPSGINGGYNDNFWHDLNPSFFPILAGGGILTEGAIVGRVQDTTTQMDYSRGFDGILKTVKQTTGSSWIGTNLFFINPYDYNPISAPFPGVGKALVNSGSFDWFILESGLFDSESMVNSNGPYDGLSRMWQIPAFAKAGKKTAIMSKVGPNLLTPPSTETMWERSQSGILAQYYLYHFPGMTSLQTIYYNNPGIGLLTTTSDYYKPGVPSNYAYQPHDMMAVDIGTPSGVIPHGYSPMQYTAVVDSALLNTPSVIGTSVSTSLYHPVYGSIPVEPTNSYYLQEIQSAPYTSTVYNPQGQPYPAEVIVARQYTKGLVVFRAPFSFPTNTPNYIADENEITVNLPVLGVGGGYRRVNYDGTLGPITFKVTLHGFEGAVFSSGSNLSQSPTTTVNNLLAHDSIGSVKVYPNPWYSGQNVESQITFSPIAAGSRMQIFSISSGRLIKTMINLNGIASWDLTNDSGESVASGIYLYAITDLESNTLRGKVCVIK